MTVHKHKNKTHARNSRPTTPVSVDVRDTDAQVIINDSDDERESSDSEVEFIGESVNPFR